MSSAFSYENPLDPLYGVRLKKNPKCPFKTNFLSKTCEMSFLTNIYPLIKNLLMFSRLDASFPVKMAELSKFRSLLKNN